MAVILGLGLYLGLTHRRPPSPVEPSFSGLSLSQWLDAMRSASPPGPAAAPEPGNAIRAMGTNALPHLAALLRGGNRWARWMWRSVPPATQQRWAPRLFLHQSELFSRRLAALRAIGFLGTNAAPFIPRLLRIAHDRSEATEMRVLAVAALLEVADGADAIDAGLQALTTDPGIGSMVWRALDEATRRCDRREWGAFVADLATRTDTAIDPSPLPQGPTLSFTNLPTVGYDLR